MGYEGFKVKLKRLDEVIASFKEITKEYPYYQTTVDRLTQERAELTSTIGRKENNG